MANIRSSKKRIRRTERQTEVNRNRMSRMRTFLKKVELAIQGGDAAAAKEALIAAQPILMRSAQKGLLHRNTASRTMSRLSARVKALSA
ncbi:MAG: 30S ribosomal protein S20 [Rhodospirillales bacterium]|nr:30S ribosomal protein S20 [Rhodospirillales bacterium]